jgi:hypothetical protein
MPLIAVDVMKEAEARPAPPQRREVRQSVRHINEEVVVLESARDERCADVVGVGPSRGDHFVLRRAGWAATHESSGVAARHETLDEAVDHNL